MIYISESEAPLDVLVWKDVQDKSALPQKIADITKLPATAQATQDITTFLAAIRQMADPKDAVMVAYAKAWEELLAWLSANLKDVQIIRVGTINVQVFIAGFSVDGCLAVHTVSVET